MVDNGTTNRVVWTGEKLNDSNYKTWRLEIRGLLTKHGLFNYVLEEVEGDGKQNCLRLLIDSISDQILNAIQEKNTPKKVWEAVETKFETQPLTGPTSSRAQLAQREETQPGRIPEGSYLAQVVYNVLTLTKRIFRLITLMVVIVAAIGSSYMYRFVYPEPNATLAKTPSCEDFLQLHSKYPNTTDMLWPTLIVGVDRAINEDPGEPATFIFLYDSSNVDQSLLEDVTSIALQCFGSSGAIWRTSNDFETVENAQDYGIMLDRYREELQSQRVLVVRELDRVSPTAAKVFFTICDSYEPLVHRAVIFFTIDISGQPREADRSPTAIAEGILKGLWREELQPDMLNPLVVRLTENVFIID